MELHQLAYFVAVAEEGSFTRAAERLHVAQPGVSAQVKRLERELGQQLLDRSGRTVGLTDVGAAALPHARAALAAVQGVREAVDELAGLVRGQVAIGAVTSAGPVGLPDLLARFHERYPAVEITLAEANSDAMLAALREGRLDLAVVGLSTDPPPGIATQVLIDEPFLAVTVGFLEGRAEVPIPELAGLPVMALPKGTGLRTALDTAFASHGLAPRIAFEAADPNVLVQLAMRGLGVAVVPESLARYHAADLAVIDIVRPRLRGVLALAWRTDGPLSPAARALIAFARASYRS
ncbi:LysR family transcriptional regulator [Amycolatopsis australiensis]|uniref:DNA-binding transcriptional regulator, LysR family n=1 Tax=Amycolatopsis australiensis TaxID=546364 RepID=A0A1K1QT55_9PSEU|nr:LysR family transcriptional regulator [Amycolatopsis australiensis]SFW63064.1 DNA-binding transcriptional regulator, LysR family [Amycolatopsis australiensis]